ncbi:hypothetical protein Tco_0374738 [Tanacetum coccineum]
MSNNDQNANGAERVAKPTTVCSIRLFQACDQRYDGKGGADLVEWSNSMRGRDAARWMLVPHMVTPESSRIKRYIAGLAPEIRGMVKAVQPTTIPVVAVLRAGILTDEAISCGTLSKGSEKRKAEDEVKDDINQRACYECGSLDHLKPTCPKLNRAPV